MPAFYMDGCCLMDSEDELESRLWTRKVDGSSKNKSVLLVLERRKSSGEKRELTSIGFHRCVDGFEL